MSGYPTFLIVLNRYSSSMGRNFCAIDFLPALPNFLDQEGQMKQSQTRPTSVGSNGPLTYVGLEIIEKLASILEVDPAKAD